MEDGLHKKCPEQVKAWEVMFAAWNEDKKHNPSPFTAPHAKKTLAEIRQELKEEEHAALGQAVDEESDASASSFLLLGLELEQTQ
ncbi:hypothetical protein EWM64_g4263 [Hericium alpestre]|uniref:Uncharacterized protein n=1 Tax=Hericium alpestre TaxID=135208 RepID=A0A4Z0A213_9AGAM|nr:hypothetical protein EWM64_g4263 [Hericium alpestre]